MPKEPGFRSNLTSLWFRLMSLGMVGLVFAEALLLVSGKVQSWTYYLATAEVVFEVVVRLIFAALAGITLGSVCTALLAPFFWHFKASRETVAEWATKVGVVLVVFLDSKLALTTLIKWSYQLSDHRSIIDTALLAAYFVAFGIALCLTRSRKEVVTSLDGLLEEKVTRRTAIATVAGAAALAATEFAFAKSAHRVTTALAPQRPKSNFLLITFDAMSAEEMSMYGTNLPTTPNIDAFARKGTVFSNFYSGSTFTTPSVATILTGTYPSESGVYQLRGRVRAGKTDKSLPHVMRAAGYASAGLFTNPFAYYLATSLENEFDVLPHPVFHPGGLQHLWDTTQPLHQDSKFGSRTDEYFDLEGVWNLITGNPNSRTSRYRPGATFEDARQILAKLPEGFFLWVHAFPPHSPYLPDLAEQGRLLPQKELLKFVDESETRWQPHYEPDQQGYVDRHRLAYNEYIASADRAFGTFMADLEARGKLRDTTVIVSADHGESFQGGVFQHGGPYQTRPVIHIPLIVRTPGQQEQREVAVTADQTAIAPTILELAGQPKPDWMRGQSLAKWLNRNGEGEGEGRAFCQYLERNSAFEPVRRGTVGVIDGHSKHQYVLDLDTQKGWLRPLNEAHIWNLDRTAENPKLAETLRAAIYSQFPDLPKKST